MIAISSLLLIIALSLVVTRAATVVLVATGLSRPVARFQARSALTGAGFTTSESEAVVNHPVRRRVVMMLMMLGNIGLVASAGSLILGFAGGGVGHDWMRAVELVIGLMALVFVSRSSVVDRWLTQAAGHVLRRYSDLPQRDLGGLLQLTGTYSVKELAVQAGDWLAGRTLAELSLRDEGVAVLGVTRPDGRYVGAPVGATRLGPGDVLVVYGREDALAALDDRPQGRVGDRQHAEAVARQARDEVAQAADDGSGPPTQPSDSPPTEPMVPPAGGGRPSRPLS